MKSCFRLRFGCFVFALLVVLGLLSCTSEEELYDNRKELLIYCGSTMTCAVEDAARLFEQRYPQVRIKVLHGGTELLRRCIQRNQVGDLYLPGVEESLNDCDQQGRILERHWIGCNRLVVMVPKGNPLHVPADLSVLVNPRYRTALGKDQSGAIGVVTKQLLVERGLYDKAMNHASFYGNNANDLVRCVREGMVDVTLNWYGVALWEENSAKVDVLPLDAEDFPPYKLVIALLNFSHYPQLAREFISLLESAEGQDIFRRYGLEK
ncbi:MAG: substrate-binding domain-containing protein [Desulfuromonadaceae bacterium]|nr:substrate-binding domain-containing protein [Desulfuromonadaceae bacterium]